MYFGREVTTFCVIVWLHFSFDFEYPITILLSGTQLTKHKATCVIIQKRKNYSIVPLKVVLVSTKSLYRRSTA